MLHAYEGHRKKRKREEKSLTEKVNDFMNSSEWEYPDTIERRVEICLSNNSNQLFFFDTVINHSNMIQSIIPFLEMNTNITSLAIHNGSLDNHSIISLAAVSKLEEIDCSENEDLGKEAVIALANNEHLLRLNISDIEFNSSDESCLVGFEALSTNNSIKELNIASNGDFSATSANNKACKLLLSNTNLTILDLKNNGITDRGLRALKNNQTLKELNLSFNSITDKSIKYILASGLRKINVAETNISDEGILLLKNKPGLSVITESYDLKSEDESNNSDEEKTIQPRRK